MDFIRYYLEHTKDMPIVFSLEHDCIKKEYFKYISSLTSDVAIADIFLTRNIDYNKLIYVDKGHVRVPSRKDIPELDALIDKLWEIDRDIICHNCEKLVLKKESITILRSLYCLGGLNAIRLFLDETSNAGLCYVYHLRPDRTYALSRSLNKFKVNETNESLYIF